MPRAMSTGGGKRHPLNMRTTREIREQLEAAAAASGRSLTQEVERRLERSFEGEIDAGAVTQTIRRLMGSLTNLEGQLQQRLDAGTLSEPDRDVVSNSLLLLSALRALAVTLHPQDIQLGASFDAQGGRPIQESEK
jgi:Arc-like DNA binding domain